MSAATNRGREILLKSRARPSETMDGVRLIQMVGDDVPYIWRVGDIDLVEDRESGGWILEKRVVIGRYATRDQVLKALKATGQVPGGSI